MTGRVSLFDTENRKPVQSSVSLKWKTWRHYSTCSLTRDMQTCTFVCVCVCVCVRRHSGSNDIIVISKSAGLIRNYETKSCPWKIQFKTQCDRDITVLFS